MDKAIDFDLSLLLRAPLRSLTLLWHLDSGAIISECRCSKVLMKLYSCMHSRMFRKLLDMPPRSRWHGKRNNTHSGYNILKCSTTELNGCPIWESNPSHFQELLHISSMNIIPFVYYYHRLDRFHLNHY